MFFNNLFNWLIEDIDDDCGWNRIDSSLEKTHYDLQSINQKLKELNADLDEIIERQNNQR